MAQGTNDTSLCSINGRGGYLNPHAEKHAHVRNPIDGMCLLLLCDCINGRFDRENLEDAPRLEGIEEESNLSPEELEVIQSIRLMLQENVGEIVSMYHQDEDLQRNIDRTFGQHTPKIECIVLVAKILFGDSKKLHWGRILSLFYFISEICVRAVRCGDLKGADLEGWMKELIVKATILIRQQFGEWIKSQGGWTAIQLYYKTSSVQFVSVMAISAIAATYVAYKFIQK